MNTSDYIAIAALLISFGSLYINKRALDNANVAQLLADKKLIESEKTEILKQISDNKSVLNKARIEIGALQANFDIEPQPVKALMKNFTSLFTENLPTIEHAISNLESDHNKILNWRGDMSYTDIMRFKATCHEDLKQFEISHEQAIECINIFKEKLILAKKRAGNVTK